MTRSRSDLPDVLTVPEVAEYLQVPRSTVYELVARKQIPSVRIGKHIRVTKEAIDGLLDQQAR